jgi:hypothetical protein
MAALTRLGQERLQVLGQRPDPNFRLERREAGVQPDRGYSLGRWPIGRHPNQSGSRTILDKGWGLNDSSSPS